MTFKDVLTIGNSRLVNGKWEPLKGVPVGTTENNGIAYTDYGKLIEVNQDTLINPANGDVLTRTKKDKAAGLEKHYFSKATGILVNAYLKTVIGGE